jgi:copper homeostasis protein
MMKLEICANSLASAVAAQKGGADRIELCDNMAEGGTTPSYGTLLKARGLLAIKLYPIIRPRGGDFLYNDEEFYIMHQDILMAKKLGCDGIVIGLLKENGHIDTRRTKKLVEAAEPLGVTFHRAFDRCRSPFQALEKIIDCGCERILTSGQQPTAHEGADLIQQLITKADNRITVMPGAGIRTENIAQLVKKTGAVEYHSTAKTTIMSKMRFENELVRKENNSISVTDQTITRNLRKKAEQAQSNIENQ